MLRWGFGVDRRYIRFGVERVDFRVREVLKGDWIDIKDNFVIFFWKVEF